MKKDLSQVVEKYLTRAGKGASAALCVSVDISPSTLRNVIHGHIPLPHRIYSIAKACGLTDRAAQKLCKKLSNR